MGPDRSVAPRQERILRRVAASHEAPPSRAARVGSEADASGAGPAPRSAGARVPVTGDGIQCRGTQEGRPADAGRPSWSSGLPSDQARGGGAPEIT